LFLHAHSYRSDALNALEVRLAEASLLHSQILLHSESTLLEACSSNRLDPCHPCVGYRVHDGFLLLQDGRFCSDLRLLDGVDVMLRLLDDRLHVVLTLHLNGLVVHMLHLHDGLVGNDLRHLLFTDARPEAADSRPNGTAAQGLLLVHGQVPVDRLLAHFVVIVVVGWLTNILNTGFRITCKFVCPVV